jgi:hypothetical protein
VVAAAVMLIDPLLEPELEPVVEAEPELPDPLVLPPAPLRPVGCSPGAHEAVLGRVTSALETVLDGVKRKRGRGDIHLADSIGKSQRSYHRLVSIEWKRRRGHPPFWSAGLHFFDTQQETALMKSLLPHMHE